MATKLGSRGMPESDNEGKGHFGNNLLIGFGLLLFFFFTSIIPCSPGMLSVWSAVKIYLFIFLNCIWGFEF